MARGDTIVTGHAQPLLQGALKAPGETPHRPNQRVRNTHTCLGQWAKTTAQVLNAARAPRNANSSPWGYHAGP
eukprot:2747997-Alexandrium_andersonii.AAC.1